MNEGGILCLPSLTTHNSPNIQSTPIARRELSPIVYSPRIEKCRTGTRSSKQKKKVQNQEQALTPFEMKALREVYSAFHQWKPYDSHPLLYFARTLAQLFAVTRVRAN